MNSKFIALYNKYLCNRDLRSFRRYYKKESRIYKRHQRIRNRHMPKAELSIYFGVPGSGKTTFASYLVRKDLRHYCDVWSNVPITGAFVLEPKDDIGKFMIKDGRVIIDEAGLEYNNRDYKNFSKDSLYFFKYHRHYNLAVDIFSQGFDDMDKKLRTLAKNLYVVKKSLFPFFIKVKRISKKVDINELTKEIIDAYYFVPLSTRWVFTPSLWKMFNTHSRIDLPVKTFTRW